MKKKIPQSRSHSLIFILQFLSWHPFHSASNTYYHLLFASFKFCNTFLPMLALPWTASVLTNANEIIFETAVPQKKLLQTERFPFQDFSPRKSLEEKEKNPHLTFWCFVILTIKCAKLNTKQAVSLLPQLEEPIPWWSSVKYGFCTPSVPLDLAVMYLQWCA